MKNSSKHQVIAKIRYLESQMTSLGHHLPDTYNYLRGELDTQKRILAELEVQETFDAIDAGGIR